MTPRFPTTCFDACGQKVIKIELSDLILTGERIKGLVDLLAASHSSASCDVTIWLAIVSKHLPTHFDQVLPHFAGFGMGLVVTHGEKCSHAPGEQLPEWLLSAIRKVNRDGQIWHPLVNELVFAEP